MMRTIHLYSTKLSDKGVVNMLFIYDDLLNANTDAICQQVNCRNAMGSGLAKAIYTRWPEIKERYHEFCNRVHDPYVLLGSVQVIKKHGSIPFDVVNVFGQLNYGRQKVCYTSYDALRVAFDEINNIYSGKTIGFPYRFACGLAGGDWDIVRGLMKTYLTDCNFRVYIQPN